MSVRRLDPIQPSTFAFSAENDAWADEQIRKYPEGKQRSAVIPLLWRAQKQAGGWLPEPAIRHVADKLNMAQIRVLEVATFYTMFNLSPVGRYFVQLCGTTPCMLRGAEELKAVCHDVIGPEHEITPDSLFSWMEVECLGACCNAPMVQINDDFYEDLTTDSFRTLLNDLLEGRDVKPGSLADRQFSCPRSGRTTLHEITKNEVPDDIIAFLAERAGADRPRTVSQASGSSISAASDGDVVARGTSAISSGIAGKQTEDDFVETRGEATPEVAPSDKQTSPAPDESAALSGRALEDVVAENSNAQSGQENGSSSQHSETVKADHLETASSAGHEQADQTMPGLRPPALQKPPTGLADDLKRISGVGPKLETTLNDLGIFHFHQIAAWTKENIDWVDEYLSFKGRIERDEWISQAQRLAIGEFSERAAPREKNNEEDA